MASISHRQVLSLLLLVSSAAFSVSIDVEYCKKNANYSVKVSGVDISPYPISRGEQTTFNISASTGDEISAGKLIIDVNYFFFHVDHEEIDLCKETSCPVTTGDFVLSHHQTLPSITPPGSYTLTMHLKGDDGKQLTCITFGFSIGFIGDAVDFTLAELKSLGVKQRFSFRDQQYNGKFSIITFEEFIAIALDANRIVGIYPEIKDPVFINQRVKWANGKKFEDKFVETLQKYGYGGAYMSTEWLKQPVFIQSFAPTSLVYISNLTDSPKIFLIDDFDIRTQDTNQSFWEISSDSYLEYIANFVIGIGPWKDTIVPTKNNYLTTPTDLVDRAHAHNLQVHTYTFRNENSYLHFDFHQDPYAEYDYWINTIGVDGLFTDFTGSVHQYQEWAQASATNEASALGLLHKLALMISSFEGEE